MDAPEPSCYRVSVTLDGHHIELVVGAMDADEAAAKAHSIFLDRSVRANTTFWAGDNVEPVVTSVVYEHQTSVHGSGPERRRLAEGRRRAKGKRAHDE